MGQRHQLFVIAKILGKYRGLAAIHHQWLYGFTAVKRCLALLKLFSAEDNRAPLIGELAAAKRIDRTDAGFWHSKPVEGKPPFPFVTTCLVLGASLAVDEAREEMVHLLDFNQDFDGADNNNGITVIDITDINDVRYCFVDFHGMESEGEVELMCPLSAETYLGAYYDLSDKSEKNQERLNTFELCLRQFRDDWRLIDVGALEDAWPRRTERGSLWKAPKGKMDDTERVAIDLNSMTLRQTARDKLLEDILSQDSANSNCDTDLSWMSDAVQLHDFLPFAIQKLMAAPQLVETSKIARLLLRRALRERTDIDLTAFSSLTAEMILDVLPIKSHSMVSSLNISANPDLDDHSLRRIVECHPRLRKLAVLDTKVTPQAAVQIAQQKDIVDVYHSDLFGYPLKDIFGHPCIDFQEVFYLTIGYPTTNSSSAELDWEKILENKVNNYRPDCIAFTASPRGCPALELIANLVHLITVLRSEDRSLGLDTTMDLARCGSKMFALSKPSAVGKLPLKVGPLPAFIDAAGMSSVRPNWSNPPLSPLSSERWTLVLADRSEILRYAFIRKRLAPQSETSVSETSTKAEVEIADVGMFLAAEAAHEGEKHKRSTMLTKDDLLAHWNATTTGIEVCSREEIQSILKVMETYRTNRELPDRFGRMPPTSSKLARARLRMGLDG